LQKLFFCLLIVDYFAINIDGNYRVFLHKKNRMVMKPNGFFHIYWGKLIWKFYNGVSQKILGTSQKQLIFTAISLTC
jgi:hypothetical protein